MPVRQHLDTLGALPFEGGAVIHEEWLRAGLVMCLYRDGGGRMVDMVSGARPTTDTATLVNSISGPVTAYTGTQVTEWPYSSAHALHGAVTLIVGYSVTSFTNYTMLVARASGAGSNNSIELRHNGSTSTDFAVVRASAGGAVASFYSSGGSSATGAHTAAVRFASGDLQEIPAFWRDGVLLTTNGTGTTGTAADAGTTRVGRRVDGVCQLDGSVGFVFGFARALTNQQVQSLMRAPGLLFAVPRAGMIGGAAGPSYSASLTESVTASDAATSALIAAAALAEAATLADAPSAAAILAAAVTEAITAAEAAAAAQLGDVALTEAAALSDSIVAAATLLAALAEAAALAESSTTGAVLTAAQSDTATLAETIGVAASLVAAVLEAAAAGDATTAAAQLVALVTEAATAADAIAGAVPATYSASVAELVAAIDLLTAVMGGAAPATSASPIGIRLSTVARRDALSALRRQANLSTRTR